MTGRQAEGQTEHAGSQGEVAAAGLQAQRQGPGQARQSGRKASPREAPRDHREGDL